MFRTLTLQALRLVACIVGAFGALGVCFAPVFYRANGLDFVMALFVGSLAAAAIGAIVSGVCSHYLEA
jgi:hypothetical protein